MNRFLGLVIALSIILFSCNESTKDKIIGKFQSDSYENVMEDSLDLLDDMAEAWENVNDKDSYKEAEAYMVGKFKDAQDAITERGKALEEGMSDEELVQKQEEMMRKYANDFEEATERLMKATVSAATKYAN